MKKTNKLKRLKKYLSHKCKSLKTLFKTIYNAMKKFKQQWKSITYIFITFILISCGSTRVSVDKPQAGTTTTITVTTNNPITTDVNPNVELKK